MTFVLTYTSLIKIMILVIIDFTRPILINLESKLAHRNFTLQIKMIFIYFKIRMIQNCSRLVEIFKEVILSDDFLSTKFSIFPHKFITINILY
ncbi:hypothetical protein BpHYR1_009560 [Brachionus plicatilis]|uniref:Uncharacterized protein n=1 Tax=Brachionus plicatilis TaxID=10195 RepID=A0A3M7QI87_BRAPC|nr:hypothetical protein BpHYR1_009560 [Brachionus plicatilis]